MNTRSIGGALLVALGLTSIAASWTGCGRPADPLDGTFWMLMAYRRTSPIKGSTITAAFEDGRVLGSAGCNVYEGSYQVTSDSIAVTDLVLDTTATCTEPLGVMDQDQFYIRFLGAVRTLRFVDDQLRLHRPDGEALTFVPHDKQ
jgi:heat shock protein HslJ